MKTEPLIRKAIPEDAKDLGKLLAAIHELHADIRPDIFKKGARKYNDAQVADLIYDEKHPIFVYFDGERVLGYAFCVIQDHAENESTNARRTLYLDDLCVDESHRGQGIATALYQYLKSYAKANGCVSVTLNVWEGNDTARRFYERMNMKVQRTIMEDIL